MIKRKLMTGWDRFCWILIFSEETGKVVKSRTYMNSAYTKEIIESPV